MVTVLADNFVDGFLKWGSAVSSAGWGTFEVLMFDADARRARVRVNNTWELLMHRDFEQNWGCPFIQGKIIGIFSHALGCPCWADEVLRVYAPNNAAVEFEIYPSEKTIEIEIEKERRKRMVARELALSQKVDEKTQDLNYAKVRAESASFAKSKFINVMSHELRTPLNIVLGGSRILKRTADKVLNDRQRQQLEDVVQAAEAITSTVNKILRYADVKFDESTISKGSVLLRLVIDEILDSLQPLFKSKHIEINDLTQSQTLPDVYSNASLLKEILQIFLTRAASDAPLSGKIQIELTSDKTMDARLEVSAKGADLSERAALAGSDDMEAAAQKNTAGDHSEWHFVEMLAEALGTHIKIRAEGSRGVVYSLDLPTHPNAGKQPEYQI